MTEHAYYLSFPEFYMLVGKGGKNTLFGFAEDGAREPSEQELVASMHRMVRSSILQSNGFFLSPQEGLKEIIRQVCAADRCLVFQFSDPVQAPLCCYIGNRVVISEISSTSSKPSVRLSLSDSDQFIQICGQLLQNCETDRYDPEMQEEEVVSSEAISYLLKDGLRMTRKQIVALDEVLWVADCVNADDGRLKNRCILIDDAMQISLALLEEDYASAVPFSRSRIDTQIQSWISRGQ